MLSRRTGQQINTNKTCGERETDMFCNGCNNGSLWIIILIIILFGWGNNGCGCGCDKGCGCNYNCGCNNGCGC